MAGYIRK